MRQSPFLDDPRDMMRRHIAEAVASPMEQVRAIHIRAAEHQAGLAKASGLDIIANRSRTDIVPGRRRAMMSRIRGIWMRLVRQGSGASRVG